MSKKVVSQYVGNRLVAKYNSVTTASGLTSVQQAHIGKVANGIRTTAGGYAWSFPKTTDLAKGLTRKNRGIGLMDSHGNLVSIFENVDTASEILGYTTSRISNSLMNNKRVRGLVFVSL